MKLSIFAKLSTVFVIALIGCTSVESSDDYLSLERIYPTEMTRFDQVGEHYFSFIGTQSIVLEDGSFLLADRANRALIQVSAQGDYIATVAREGRGPGEILDLTFLSGTPSNGVVAYDQQNRKVLEFDNKTNFKSEFVAPPVEGGMLIEAYLFAPNTYLLVYRNLQQYLSGVDIVPTLQLVVYDKEAESIVKSVNIEDALLATHIQDGVVRGGRRVDFGPNPLQAYNSNKGIFYSFWSGGDKVALMNENLDTLSTLRVDLSTELLSTIERDSLRNSMDIDRWRELEPLLPRRKAIAQDMHVDSSDNLWLLLNHRSDWNEWLVVEPDGKPKHMVMLPKRSFLTHISEHHLGVRVDDGTLALFEPIN
ncbi:MAG: hypothetical protein LAT57_13640 [Balneolales bacterium]|nr:hypothetical protein [Balneolales bacterium]